MARIITLMKTILLSLSRLSFLISKFMPTLLLSPHRQLWEEMDSDCADAVSFSDSSCGAHGMRTWPFLQRRPCSGYVWLTPSPPRISILHWEGHFQVKHFCKDCWNSGDSLHLYSTVTQQIQALLYQQTSARAQIKQPGSLRGGCQFKVQLSCPWLYQHSSNRPSVLAQIKQEKKSCLFPNT